jgi:hypothetical protein
MVELCTKCFQSSCEHKVDKFECDDLMVYPIQRLNELGYRTKFCCSGHMNAPNGMTMNDAHFLQCYIMFEKAYHFPVLPPNWQLSFNAVHNVWTIEAIETSLWSESKKRHRHIMDSMRYLTGWVDELEPWDRKVFKYE